MIAAFDLMGMLKTHRPDIEWPFTERDVLQASADKSATYMFKTPEGLHYEGAQRGAEDTVVMTFFTTKLVVEVIGEFHELGEVVYQSGMPPVTHLATSETVTRDRSGRSATQ